MGLILSVGCFGLVGEPWVGWATFEFFETAQWTSILAEASAVVLVLVSAKLWVLAL